MSPPAASEPLRLYTFTLSHFSEKIRWALSASDIAFKEVPWTPFFHVLPALRSGGRTTVPILESNTERVQDSTRILHWLEENRGRLAILPENAAEREAAFAIEERFDKVGDHVVRYAYSRVLEDAESVVRYWTLDATPRQARLIAASFPALRWIFRRKLRTTPSHVAGSRAVIESALDWLDARVSGENPYLVGDRFTVADLTAAALLAPLVCPDEHPVYGTNRYRAGAAPLTSDFRDRAAFAWVRMIYAKHRGASFSFRADEIRKALDGN